jgi:L-amino acid N-acyltransferase YncA
MRKWHGSKTTEDRQGEHRAEMIIADYDINPATPEDMPGVVVLQDANLPEQGGSLSVRHGPDWFLNTMGEMPLVVARRDGKIVGYVVASSLGAQSHVPILQAMLGAFTAPPDCYLYGPICVAATERGRGLAGRLFDYLCASLPGRPAITFVRADNDPSLRAHKKMGFSELGRFMSGGVSYVALTWTAQQPKGLNA